MSCVTGCVHIGLLITALDLRSTIDCWPPSCWAVILNKSFIRKRAFATVQHYCCCLRPFCSPYSTLNLYGDRAFPVAAIRTWISLPQHVTSAPSLSFLLRSLQDILLRTVLFIILLSCLRSDVVILDTLIVLLTYLLTYYAVAHCYK